MNKILFLALFTTAILVLVGSSQGAYADVIQSADSGDWSDATIWVGGNVPGSLDTAKILRSHTVELTDAQTTHKVNVRGTLDISASGSVTTIGESPIFTVIKTGKVFNDGAIFVGSSATINGILNNNAGGMLTIDDDMTITNQGILNNDGTIILGKILNVGVTESVGTFNNNAGATLTGNGGSLQVFAGSNFDNSGTVDFSTTVDGFGVIISGWFHNSDTGIFTTLGDGVMQIDFLSVWSNDCGGKVTHSAEFKVRNPISAVNNGFLNIGGDLNIENQELYQFINNGAMFIGGTVTGTQTFTDNPSTCSDADVALEDYSYSLEPGAGKKFRIELSDFVSFKSAATNNETAKIDQIDLGSISDNDETILPPLKQIKSGISAEDVKCKEGLELLISFSGKPACVNPSSVIVLIARHW